jgi:hypothetical protein
MNCKEYILNIDEIEVGDAILFKNKGIVSKLIRLLDKCRYSHIAIVDIFDDELVLIQMDMANGIELVPLSKMMELNTDYALVKINSGLILKRNSLRKIHDLFNSNIKYEKVLLLKIILRKFFKFNIINDQTKMICYDLFNVYLNMLGISELNGTVVTGKTLFDKFKTGKIIE